MEIGKHREVIRTTFEQAYKSCLHFAVATVNRDGSPHVAPIGALILRDDHTGYYFDEHPVKTPSNLSTNPKVCVLALNADKSFLGEALMEGRFAYPPAVRLSDVAGQMRKATATKSRNGEKGSLSSKRPRATRCYGIAFLE